MSMRSLQISCNDLMGRRFNGHDLHIDLAAKGMHAEQIVWNKLSDDADTYELGRMFKERNAIQRIIDSMQEDLAAPSTMYPFSFSLLYDSKFLETDIVHYHLIHNSFFNITHLPILTRLKPSVWTLHDPWAITGHCVHFFDCKKWKMGCGDCPNLDAALSMHHDTTALNWEIKRLAYQSSDLDVVVSSKWMYDLVKSSPLTQHFEAHVIPFGIDLSVFKPICKKEVRDFLKIPIENKVIAFRASRWPLKGLKYIKEVAEKYENVDNVTLLVNGETGLVKELADRYHVVDLGWIDNTEMLVKYYNAADVFVMPSEAESFGLSAVEAMACGTPVVVFDDTVLSDTIFAPQGGIAVRERSSEALGQAINQLLDNPELRNDFSESCLRITRERYSQQQYIERIMQLYQYVVEKRSNDKRADYLVSQMKKVKHDEAKLHSYDNVIREICSLFLVTSFSRKLSKYPLLREFFRKIYYGFKKKFR